MRAAVYRGANDVRVEELPVPPLEAGELLLKVAVCGVCGTDLKKIVHGDLPPPLVFGHEVAGRVEAVGQAVRGWKPGDRAVFFHHIPCRNCPFCRAKNYAQCPQYKRVGTTAGFEPSGGGFAEFVKVKDWIVREGLVKIPEGVEDEEASFVEPVNTCLKGIEKAGIGAGSRVLILGSGPVGLTLLQLARLKGADVSVADPIQERLTLAKALGARETTSPEQLPKEHFDIALVAAASAQAVPSALDAVRPAGRVVLFAQTRVGDLAPVDVGQIGKLEKELIGSYSASVDLQAKSADLVFTRQIQVKPLITHRFGLDQINEAIHVALNPSPSSLKVIIRFGLNGSTR
ncbi:MAG: alcohol dehydrogenase catalytic domain-containing protein [Candidatus Omnitrophica bacterium]|nr:alcohol dehydrogenase catalytic domain-containing protein [Candidatus Omnitrophota bacterium]